MENEIEELQKGLDSALASHDGWLCHYYGSQLYHLQLLKEQSERRRMEFRNRMDQIKQECDDRANDRMLRFKFGIH